MARVNVYERSVNAVLLPENYGSDQAGIRIIIKSEPPDQDTDYSDEFVALDAFSPCENKTQDDSQLNTVVEASKEVLSDKENRGGGRVYNTRGNSDSRLSSQKRPLSDQSIELPYQEPKKRKRNSSLYSTNPENITVDQDSSTNLPKDEKEQEENEKEKDVTKFTCSVCSIVMRSEMTLKYHIQYYRATFLHKCDMCHAILPRSKALRQHKILCEQWRKDPSMRLLYNYLECNFCGRCYQRKQFLQSHLFHYHGDLIAAGVSNVERPMPDTVEKETPKNETANDSQESSNSQKVPQSSTTSPKKLLSCNTPSTKMRQTTLVEFIESVTTAQQEVPGSPVKDSGRKSPKFRGSKHSPSDRGLKTPSRSLLQSKIPMFVNVCSPTKSTESTSQASNKPFVQIHVNPEVMLALFDEHMKNASKRVASLRQSRRLSNKIPTLRREGLDEPPKTAKILEEQLKAKFKVKECVVRLCRCDWASRTGEKKINKSRSVDRESIESGLRNNPAFDLIMKDMEIPLSKVTRLIGPGFRGFDTFESKPTLPNDNNNSNVQKKFPCKMCKKSFSSKENLREHTDLLHVAYMSPICRARFTTMNKLLRHYLRDHRSAKRNVCCVCRAQVEPATMPKHLVLHCVKIRKSYKHNIPVDVKCDACKKRYRCKDCGKRFWVESCLKEHRNVRHQKNKKRSPVKAKNSLLRTPTRPTRYSTRKQNSSTNDISVYFLRQENAGEHRETPVRSCSPSKYSSSSRSSRQSCSVNATSDNSILKSALSKNSARFSPTKNFQATEKSAETISDNPDLEIVDVSRESNSSLAPASQKTMRVIIAKKNLANGSIDPTVPNSSEHTNTYVASVFVVSGVPTSPHTSIVSSQPATSYTVVTSSKPLVPQATIISNTQSIQTLDNVNDLDNTTYETVSTEPNVPLIEECENVESQKEKVVSRRNANFFCSICDLAFSSFERLCLHERTYSTVAIYKCFTCGTSFTTARLLHTHMIATHADSGSYRYAYFCQICKQGFTKKWRLRVHERHFHNTNRILETINTVCSVCNLMFESYDRFIEHNSYYYNGQKYTCTFCAKTFKGMYVLHNHCKMVHYPLNTRNSYKYLCDVCGEGFKHQSHFHAHRFHLHRDEPSTRAFILAMQDHNYAVEASITASSETTHQVPIKRYTCGTCCASFTSEEDLLLHETEYSLDGKFRCERCGRKCSTAAILTKHQILTHYTSSIHSSYKCSLCGEVLTTSVSMLSHERHFHAQIDKDKDNSDQSTQIVSPRGRLRRKWNNYMCLTCRTTFKNDSLLKNHILEYADIGNYVCDICYRKFTEPECLNVHKFKHMNQSNSEFKHKCPICLEGFPSVSNVRIHVMHLHKYNTFLNVEGEEESESTMDQFDLPVIAKSVVPYGCARKVTKPKKDGLKTAGKEMPVRKISLRMLTESSKSTSIAKENTNDTQKISTNDDSTDATDVYFTCPVCNMICQNMGKFKKHFKAEHTKMIQQLISSNEPVEQIKCSVCSAVCPDRNDFKSHVASTHGTTLLGEENNSAVTNTVSEPDDQVRIVLTNVARDCSEISGKMKSCQSSKSTNFHIKIDKRADETKLSENVDTRNQELSILKVKSFAKWTDFEAKLSRNEEM